MKVNGLGIWEHSKIDERFLESKLFWIPKFEWENILICNCTENILH